jgi:pantoate--beta-alanine ligase
MQVLRSANEMQANSIGLRTEGKLIGFVPTMGYLHAGHLSLVEEAKAKSDITVVSIFVNPTQFSVGEDLERYPRDLERDLKMCEEHGVDIVFVPSNMEMYPAGHSTQVKETAVSADLCGVSRPAHFQGVATVCAKLFNLCRPDFVVFGQKDAQQAVVIRRMVVDLNFPIEIVVAPTIRDEDGLAMSSRNACLDPRQREDALLISRSLFAGKSLVDDKGIRNVDRIKSEVTGILTSGRCVRLNYVEVVNRENMKTEAKVEPGRSMIVVAAWIDEVRLIDNVML